MICSSFIVSECLQFDLSDSEWNGINWLIKQIWNHLHNVKALWFNTELHTKWSSVLTKPWRCEDDMEWITIFLSYRLCVKLNKIHSKSGIEIIIFDLAMMTLPKCWYWNVFSSSHVLLEANGPHRSPDFSPFVTG